MPIVLGQLIRDLQEIESRERDLNSVISDLKEDQGKKEVWVVRRSWKSPKTGWEIHTQIEAVYFTKSEAVECKKFREKYFKDYDFEGQQVWFTVEYGIGSYFTVDYKE